MDICDITEESILELLVNVSKANGDDTPRAFVHKRTQVGNNSLTRKVSFILIVSIDNIKLIDALVKASLGVEGFYFTGSEVNLQSDLTIQYIHTEASIMAKIQD